MPYSLADVANAIARANGQPLKDIKGGFGGRSAMDLGPSRRIGAQKQQPYKKSTGHAFAHVATFTDRYVSDATMQGIAKAQAGKSLWVDRHTAIAASHEMINSAQCAAGLRKFAAGSPPDKPEWIQTIPLAGDYYGRPQNENYTRRATTGSINYWVAGAELFIYSSYPDGFISGVAGIAEAPDFSDLAYLF